VQQRRPDHHRRKTVTVTYGDKAAAFTVNVINSAADAFALAKSNAKAEFLSPMYRTSSSIIPIPKRARRP
jgi:hypothetical protein